MYSGQVSASPTLVSQIAIFHIYMLSCGARLSHEETRPYDTNIVPSLQPQLQWKRCADMPVEMARPQVVVMGEKVYIGGADTEDVENYNQVFQYNLARDEGAVSLPAK